MPRADLVGLCGYRTPKTQVGGTGTSPAWTLLNGTITTWKNLGMIEGEDDCIGLSHPFSAIETQDLVSLRRTVLLRLMTPENSPGGQELASDFTRLASWLLSQDPYRISQLKPDDVLELGNKQGFVPWMGGGRYESYQEWADFCGLGMTTRYGYITNPAPAIRMVLTEWRTRNEMSKWTIELFIKRLAEALPILESGAFRVKVDQETSQDDWNRRRVSPCTSLALLQLQHEGECQLLDEAGDVADSYALLGRNFEVIPNWQRTSHVRMDTPLFNRSQEEE